MPLPKSHSADGKSTCTPMQAHVRTELFLYFKGMCIAGLPNAVIADFIEKLHAACVADGQIEGHHWHTANADRIGALMSRLNFEDNVALRAEVEALRAKLAKSTRIKRVVA